MFLIVKKDYTETTDRDDPVITLSDTVYDSHKTATEEMQSMAVEMSSQYIERNEPISCILIPNDTCDARLVNEDGEIDYESIKKTDIEKRGTCLAHRLQELA